MIKLTSDNATPKRTIEVSAEDLKQAIKKVLRWRTNKGYFNLVDRFRSCSSLDYDKVIEYLHQNGKGVKNV